MTDIHQSPLYAQFMQRIGWRVERVENVYCYIKSFPYFGGIIKIQRPDSLPSKVKLLQLIKKYRIRSAIIEPTAYFHTPLFTTTLATDPFLPTKTIRINLRPSEKTIFARFASAKRQAVRRAQKNNLRVVIGTIENFVQLKKQTSGLLGFLTTKTLKPLWDIFSPKNGFVLIAQHHQKPVAAVFILQYKQTAYYWLATTTNDGKHTAAPTLLVWEAIKKVKKNGATIFDFEGVYDERFPKHNRSWQGFTRFKTGFGGKQVYYPPAFKLTTLA